MRVLNRLWRGFETGIRKHYNQREKVMRSWKDLTITDCRIKWVLPEPSPSLLMDNLLMPQMIALSESETSLQIRARRVLYPAHNLFPNFLSNYWLQLHPPFWSCNFQKMEAWSSYFRNNGLNARLWTVKSYQGERAIIFIFTLLTICPLCLSLRQANKISFNKCLWVLPSNFTDRKQRLRGYVI